jgi:hypothetical protein
LIGSELGGAGVFDERAEGQELAIARLAERICLEEHLGEDRFVGY